MDVQTLYIARTADGIGLDFPSYTSKYHVGLNLQVALASAVRLDPGDRISLSCGFAIGIPDGYCGQVVSLPKAAKELGLIVLDAPHIIHPADRDPLFLLLQNTSAKQVVLHRGDYVAQLIITPVIQAAWREFTAETDKKDTSADAESMVVHGFSENAGSEDKMVSPRRVYKSARNRFADEPNGKEADE